MSVQNDQIFHILLGMRNHQCSYPRGKALGGSHLLSGMIYARGNKADYDGWAAKLGDPSWSYESLLPYFKKIEHDATKNPLHTAQYHGFDGLLYVNYSLPNSLNYEQIMQASAELGLFETDVNGGSQVGIEKISWMTKNNVRETGGNIYIKPILDRNNLRLELEAFVTEIIIDGDTATGVRFIKDNKLYSAKASKEVILSAGSINSPQILMLSGIGPQEELQRLDIEVKNDLPVGKYLSDHPCFIGLYVRTKEVYPNLTLAEYLERYLRGYTPFTNLFGGEHIGFLNTRFPGINPPNIEFISVNPPMSIPSQQFFNFDDQTFKWISGFNPLTDFAMYIINIKPKSRGWVRLQSKSPRSFPLINPGFLTDEDNDDIQVLYEGIQFVVNMMNTETMRAIDATVFSNSPRCEHLKEISEMDYWYCAIGQHTNTIFHPTGTTKMGVSPLYSVVDSEFRVHRMKRLRVCDAGAMPDIVSGHPIAAVMVMGERLGDILKNRYCSNSP